MTMPRIVSLTALAASLLMIVLAITQTNALGGAHPHSDSFADAGRSLVAAPPAQ